MNRCPECGRKDCCGADMCSRIAALESQLVATQSVVEAGKSLYAVLSETEKWSWIVSVLNEWITAMQQLESAKIGKKQ